MNMYVISCRYLTVLFGLVCLIDFNSCGNLNFYPNLPTGEFKINFKGVIGCVPPGNDKLQFNFYASKKSAKLTEIKGNFTAKIPLDDRLNFEVNMAIKDSIGGWKDNAFVYKAPKACTTIKYFLGNSWTPITTILGGKNISCPIPAGIYVSPGIDTSLWKMSNIPKTFFYGTYKFRSYFTKNNEVYGCRIYIVDILRPWEN